ncbi:MAG: hypothetical protein EZS28_056357, partial [Streblomastix strix]
EGMRFFHSSGFVHRDLKCNNILFHCPPGSGRVYAKIGDFGLAVKENKISQESNFVGTTPYMV